MPENAPVSLVSVVVCTYNRADALSRCLDSLRVQDRKDFEIIVVDGPSTDGTDKVLAKYNNVKVVRQETLKGLSNARNLGIGAAKGEIVAFLDDDAIAQPGWLSSIVAPFGDKDVSGAGGKVVQLASDHVQFMNGTVSMYGRSKPVHPAPQRHYDPAGKIFNNVMGTNMAFRRATLERLGGFDERYSYFFDETDLAVRAILAGGKVLHVPAAVVLHEHAVGHNRESRWELKWDKVGRMTSFFTLKNFGRRIGPIGRALGPLATHLKGIAGFGKLFLAREISAGQAIKFSAALMSGYREGVRDGRVYLRER